MRSWHRSNQPWGKGEYEARRADGRHKSAQGSGPERTLRLTSTAISFFHSPVAWLALTQGSVIDADELALPRFGGQAAGECVNWEARL